MLTLDQVLLLEQKVESAVGKIQQLQAENDALRKKCSELTNALSVKSEQLSSFEQNQTQIEVGVKKALDRLNAIENSVLKASAQVSGQQYSSEAVAVSPKPQAAEPASREYSQQPVEKPVDVNQTVEQAYNQSVAPSFDTMQAVSPESDFSGGADTADDDSVDAADDDAQDELGFDIF